MMDWLTIRNLKKKRPDLGTRRIARLLGISKNTVRPASDWPSIQSPALRAQSILIEVKSYIRKG